MSARELVDAGRAALRAGEIDAAVAKFTQATQAAPDDADAWLGLGACFAERGRFDGAIAHFERAVAIAPTPPALLALVTALTDAGQLDAALARAQSLVHAHPGFTQGWNGYGSALARAQRLDDAAQAFAEAARLDPGYRRPIANLARLEAARGNLDAASAWYERWIGADPASFDARLGLARARHRQALVIDAIARYREALAIRDDADARNDLGNAYTDIADIAAAQVEFRRALAIRPDYAEVHSNLLLNLHYGGDVDADAMFAEHLEWAKRYANVAHVEPTHGAPRNASRRLRVGFVGSSFAGAVGAFVEPLIARIDRRRFDVVCYSAHPFVGDVATRIARDASASHDVSAMFDDTLASRIVDERIDIVVDLAGHTPGNRLRALARKPAPLIVTWLDYFDTTGVAEVDCLFADSIAVPVDTCQRFTEEVVRFAPSRLCYAPPAYAPGVSSATRNAVTFGSFNRLSKLAPAVRALWARILHAVPDSRLVLKNAAFADPAARDLFARHFAMLGVAGDRLELREASPHARMLAEYGDIDVALDPFPYNGGLTTCEALWMGVPVVCLAGDSMIARQSASLVTAAGFGEFVAVDADDYVARAVDLARRRDGRVTSRREMRERVRASTLCDAAAFARNFERALVEAFERRTA